MVEAGLHSIRPFADRVFPRFPLLVSPLQSVSIWVLPTHASVFGKPTVSISSPTTKETELLLHMSLSQTLNVSLVTPPRIKSP